MVRKHVLQVAAVAGLGLLWAAAGQGQGLKLKGVEVLSVGDGARVVLDVDGAVTPKSFRLSNPERIVIDLAGAANGVKVGTQTFASGPVSRVRVSQFKSDPQPVTRVVADLRSRVAYQVETQDEDVVVVVGEAAAAPVQGASVSGTGSETTAAVVDGVGAGSAGTTGEASAYVPFTPVASEVGESVVTPAAAGESAPGTSTSAGGETASTTVVPSVEMPVAVVPSVETPVAVATATVETAVVSAVAPVEPAAVAAVSTVSEPVAPAVLGAASADEVAAQPEPMQVAVPSRKPGRSHRVAHVALDEDTSPDAPPGGVELTPTGTASRVNNDRRINIDVQGADIHVVLRTLADYSGKNIIAAREVEGTVSARLYDTPWEDALNSILKAHGYSWVEERGIIRVGVAQKIRNEELEDAASERKREDLLPIETQVVRLEFADAKELKPSLEDMMSQRGKLQVDARTNALIISDISDYVAKVVAMAHDLDSRTTQVEIVSKLVDVSADESRDLGIQWDALNLQAKGAPVIGSADVQAASAKSVSHLRLGTVQSWGQLSAVLDAMEKNKKANVVSNPNITTVNNREARILVGSKIPLIVADQAGNAITQLTKIGIQMSCTPHINSDKTITLDLHTEVSDLSSQATVQGGVIIQTSEADTRVLVETGDTAIIGGLVRNVSSSVRTGVPILQDVPLFGWFFRNTNMVSNKRELIIFVTPRLIEPGQKLEGPRPEGSKP